MPHAGALAAGGGPPAAAAAAAPLLLLSPPGSNSHNPHRPHVNAFQHTQLGVHLSAGAAALYVLGDVLPTLLGAHRASRTWLWLLGLLGGSAYLYARPFIRGLGSAHRWVGRGARSREAGGPGGRGLGGGGGGGGVGGGGGGGGPPPPPPPPPRPPNQK